ncbi:MAG: hypothetical protein K5695_11860 [Oscillospiraceae bacterium]|nr:hypothetical protein [Oscillospiraceae bacterium]
MKHPFCSRMTEAVAFDTQDSAPDGCRIIYQAYEDETPVFSGARQVTGWEKVSDTLYLHDRPDARNGHQRELCTGYPGGRLRLTDLRSAQR